MDDLITDSRYSWVRLGLTLFVATIINAGMWAIIVIMPAYNKVIPLEFLIVKIQHLDQLVLRHTYLRLQYKFL